MTETLLFVHIRFLFRFVFFSLSFTETIEDFGLSVNYTFEFGCQRRWHYFRSLFFSCSFVLFCLASHVSLIVDGYLANAPFAIWWHQHRQVFLFTCSIVWHRSCSDFVISISCVVVLLMPVSQSFACIGFSSACLSHSMQTTSNSVLHHRIQHIRKSIWHNRTIQINRHETKHINDQSDKSNNFAPIIKRD